MPVGQAVCLGLLPPPFLQPLHQLAPLTSSSGPWPKMSQPFQETQGLTPDHLDRESPPDLTNRLAELPAQAQGTSGPGHRLHMFLCKVSNQSMEVLAQICPRTSDKLEQLIAPEPLNKGTRRVLAARPTSRQRLSTMKPDVIDS